MWPSKIVSGGQTGADRGGLDAAIELGIPYGGYVPNGRRAEDGKVPMKYAGLMETRSDGYLVRTRLNVQNSTATVIFTHGALSSGSLKTKQFCEEYGKPFLHIDLLKDNDIADFVEWFDSIKTSGQFILNVAGQRESKAHGIQKEVKQFLMRVLSL